MVFWVRIVLAQYVISLILQENKCHFFQHRVKINQHHSAMVYFVKVLFSHLPFSLPGMRIFVLSHSKLQDRRM